MLCCKDTFDILSDSTAHKLRMSCFAAAELQDTVATAKLVSGFFGAATFFCAGALKSLSTEPTYRFGAADPACGAAAVGTLNCCPPSNAITMLLDFCDSTLQTCPTMPGLPSGKFAFKIMNLSPTAGGDWPGIFAASQTSRLVAFISSTSPNPSTWIKHDFGATGLRTVNPSGPTNGSHLVFSALVATQPSSCTVCSAL